MILSGKIPAQAIRKEIAKEVAVLKRKPKLAVILVGENPASVAYVGQKRKACAEVGMAFELVELPITASESDVLEAVAKKNADAETDGIIVQLPLPDQVNRNRVIETISAKKDVDGFTKESVAGVFFGKREGFVPCTPKGIMRLLSHYGISPEGKNVTVIGYGNIVGKPLSILLANAGATVTACHSRTRDIGFHAKEADVIIVAAGKPGLLKAEMVRPGAVVIDVGINRIGNGTLVGDSEFAEISEFADITPVPGGVGPMTVAMLLENTLEAYGRQEKWE